MNKFCTYKRILFLGAGGTGSLAASFYLRYLAGQKERLEKTRIIICDGDTVEPKNIQRQMFGYEDVGRNKAEALADILGSQYGITVSYHDGYINKREDLEKIFPRISNDPFYRTAVDEKLTYRCATPMLADIIVGCVDNHTCRKVINEYFIKSSNQFLLWFDSANEYSWGEVVFGAKLNNEILSPSRCHFFPEILEDTGLPRSEESCEALNAVEPQHLATNIMAANVLFTALTQLDEGTMPSGIVHFDSFGYSMRQDPYNVLNLKVKGG